MLTVDGFTFGPDVVATFAENPKGTEEDELTHRCNIAGRVSSGAPAGRNIRVARPLEIPPPATAEIPRHASPGAAPEPPPPGDAEPPSAALYSPPCEAFLPIRP